MDNIVAIFPPDPSVSHPYPPIDPSQHEVSTTIDPSQHEVFTTINHVTLRLLHITVSDAPGLLVYFVTERPRFPIQLGTTINNISGTFHVDRLLRQNSQVTLYSCQERVTHTQIIVATATRWTSSEDASVWERVAQLVQLVKGHFARVSCMYSRC
jgi:hypothetical protein